MRFCILAFFFATACALSASSSTSIESINQEIESLLMKILSPDSTVTTISDLEFISDQCEQRRYLAGDVQILHLKVATAMQLGNDGLLETWLSNYERKIEQSVDYGIMDRERYYRALKAVLSIYVNGFQYQRGSLESQIHKARLTGDVEVQAELLYEILRNVDFSERSGYINRMDSLIAQSRYLQDGILHTNFAVEAGNYYAEVDSIEEATKYYKIAQKSAASWGSQVISNSIDYKLFLLETEEGPLSPAEIDTELYYLRLMMTDELIGDSEEAALRIAYSYFANQQYPEAETVLKEYITYMDETIAKRSELLANYSSSKYFHILSDKSLDTYKAESYCRILPKLANYQILQGKDDQYDANMRMAIEYAKQQGDASKLVEIYISMAYTQSILGDRNRAMDCIENAIQSLRGVGNDECSMPPCYVYWALEILWFYLDEVGLESSIRCLNKALRLAQDALSSSVRSNNLQYQYDCLLALGAIRGTTDELSEERYRLYLSADSLASTSQISRNHQLEAAAWRLFVHYGEIDRLRSSIRGHYEYHLQSGDIQTSIELSILEWFTRVCLNTKADADYEEYFSMIDEIRSHCNDKNLQQLLVLYVWHAQLQRGFEGIDVSSVMNRVYEDYRALELTTANLNSPDVFASYLAVGLTLLSHIALNPEDQRFEALLEFIEPLNWQRNSYLEGDRWFISFVDGTYGWYNEQLYYKYISSILESPLSSDRLESRISHAKYLQEAGERSPSITEFEKAVVEAKQLGLLEMEVEILAELGRLYRDNRQQELAERRLLESLMLAKKIGYVGYLDNIYCFLLDGALSIQHSNYLEILHGYLENSQEQELLLGQVQAFGHLVSYHSLMQDTDMMISYMLLGFDLRNTLNESDMALQYLNFTSICLKAIDASNELVPIVLDYFAGAKVHDKRIQTICRNLEALKDYEIEELRETNITEYPFLYADVLNSRSYLRELFDNKYTQADEFSKLVDFLIQLEGENHDWGLINALWKINDRIKDIESEVGDPTYTGFGFRYGLIDNALIVNAVFANSPAADLLLVDDEIIELEGARISPDSFKIEIAALSRSGAQTSFTIVRDQTDTLNAVITPGRVQPNPYSVNPIEEIDSLTRQFFSISDNLLDSADNIQSYPGFLKDYREFLMYYPIRYLYLHNSKAPCDTLMSILNRYESVSTSNLLLASSQHKQMLIENPILMQEYQLYSEKINQIQYELSSVGLNSMTLHSLRQAKANAYNELDYYTDYTLAMSDRSNLHMGANVNLDLSQFSDFDAIFRFCSSEYSNNVAFGYVEDNLVASLVTNEDALRIMIKAVMQYMEYSVTREPSSYSSRLNELLVKLTEAILGSVPVFSEIDQPSDMLVIPEGVLNFVPFELLLCRISSDTTTYYYLTEIANITYAPSLCSYLLFKERDMQRGEKPDQALLVAANPQTVTSPVLDNLLALRSDDLGDIQHVDTEVEAIHSILSKNGIHVGLSWVFAINSSVISETLFKERISEEIEYVHLAAHGIHDLQDYRNSGILLGQDTDTFDDGILQSHEIFPLELQADLVTLSSCFSGFGEIDPNEGNLGIYRSFLIAGANNVIISLWEVEDESTALLFAKFYEYLMAGHSKAASLRLAKLYLKDNTGFNHPYYWAPFVLYGIN